MTDLRNFFARIKISLCSMFKWTFLWGRKDIVCNSYIMGARDVWHLLHRSPRALRPRVECNVEPSRNEARAVDYPKNKATCLRSKLT